MYRIGEVFAEAAGQTEAFKRRGSSSKSRRRRYPMSRLGRTPFRFSQQNRQGRLFSGNWKGVHLPFQYK
jgi:hypothetical protein